MNIDSNLLKEFAKITNDSEVKTENKYLRGTIVKNSGGKYVQLDGSTTVTPISELVDVEEGDRVLVSIENHKATIVGNFTFPPSARKEQEAIDKSNAAQESATKAETTANAAQEKAKEAGEKADTAISQSSIASASADEAKQQATEAINKANDAQENIQEAKDLATQASADASEAKQQAAASQASSAEAQAEVTRLQGEVTAAQEDADKALEDLETQAGEITAIKENYATKVEVGNTKAELETTITKKVGELETTISKNYSTKTENVELEGKLQSQITQNAEGLTSQASKIEKIEADTTEAQKDVADALSKASAAQSAASEAQTKANAAQSAADQASADAASATEKANTAKNAADAATAAANAADKAVQEAQGDLDEAKQNLASVTSRVDATEADIAEAQQKVDAAQTSVNEALADAAEANAAATKAQEAADKAQTDAETAQGVANTAQQKADNAKTAADNAQTAANKAQADVAALTSRVTTAETKIEQNNQAISLNASKTEEIGTKVDNIQVGGRNYVLQSKGVYTISLNGTRNYNTKILDISPILKDIDPNIKTFSISYDAYSQNGGTKLQGYLRASDTTAAMSTSTPALGISTTSWARYHRIGKINDGYTVADIANFYIRIENDNDLTDKVYVKNVKVEVGNTPTDWTPAPEDVQANIDNIEVGGRNYILKSNNFTDSNYFKVHGMAEGVTHAVEDGVWKITTTEGNLGWMSWGKNNTIESNFQTDDEFTFSIEIKCDEGSTGKPTVYFKSGMGYYKMEGEVSTEYSILYYTGKWIDTNSISFHFQWGSTVGTFYIRKMKFEKGNKATDWTPAPEDIENELATNYYTKTQTDAQIKVQSDRITSTVSRVETVEKTASTAQTTANNAQTAVNNLDIGGRNILLNSSFRENANKWEGVIPEIIEFDGKKCAHYKHTALKSTKHVTQSVLGKLEPNTKYTMSGWVRTDNIVKGTTNPTIMFYHDGHYDNNGTSTWFGYISKGFTINTGVGSWQYLTVTFTTDDKLKTATKSGIFVYTRDITGDIYFYNLKLEKGNKATDWTPAPEDVQANIDGVQANVDNIEVGGRNILPNADFANKSVVTAWDTEKNGNYQATGWGGHNSGVANATTCYHAHLTELDGEWVYDFTKDTETWLGINPVCLGTVKPGEEYTFSCEILRPAGSLNNIHGGPYYGTEVETTKSFKSGYFYFQNTVDDKWEKFSHTFTMKPDKLATSVTFYIYGMNGVGTVYMRKPKLELGNKATDWTLAPEDTDTKIDDAQTTANTANDAADAANKAVSEAKSSIQQLADMIEHLVTDENGTSMMTQTSTGWTFNLKSINDNLKAVDDGLKTLNGKHDTTSGDVSSLQKQIDELMNGKLAYINMGTDDKGNPCIELGKKTDNPDEKDFKVRITNEAIDFLEGASRIAYANNNTFYAEKMIVKNELQIGIGPGFVWRTRANGNMGLVYISG